MTKLGVNIDHVATLRQARMALEPDTVLAALAACRGGADGITVHLREDRRHIQDLDVARLKKAIKTKLNLEMSLAPEIVKIAQIIKPQQATFVPERRQELTTEGGLDVCGQKEKIKQAVKKLKARGIKVSLFIEPDIRQIKATLETGAEYIELHTGKFANAKGKEQRKQLEILRLAAVFSRNCGLKVNAGHGLNYENTGQLLKSVPGLEELNIGHSIISRAMFVGIGTAVKEMKRIISRNTRRKGK